MPVLRFRTFDEARRALWIEAGAPDLAERIRRLWTFSARLTPRRFAHGVTRFRSIEEAQRARGAWGSDRAD